MSVPVRRAACEREGGGACALLLALLATLALAHADAEKRAEMSAAPFVLGSRYGRSPPRLITPRNDRFFMGSRYGKRSEVEGPLPPQVTGMFPEPPQVALLCAPAPLAAPLLPALYYCRLAPRLRPYDNRENEDPSATEEV